MDHESRIEQNRSLRDYSLPKISEPLNVEIENRAKHEMIDIENIISAALQFSSGYYKKYDTNKNPQMPIIPDNYLIEARNILEKELYQREEFKDSQFCERRIARLDAAFHQTLNEMHGYYMEDVDDIVFNADDEGNSYISQLPSEKVKKLQYELDTFYTARYPMKAIKAIDTELLARIDQGFDLDTIKILGLPSEFEEIPKNYAQTAITELNENFLNLMKDFNTDSKNEEKGL